MMRAGGAVQQESLLPRERNVDSFAGFGGASLGMKMAGFPADFAINHDAEAIALHTANHPESSHFCQNVWKFKPGLADPVGLLWLSPDCKHFSKAKGGKPVNKKVRGLAWLAVYWAKRRRGRGKPRVIILENVEEFQKWGPLNKDGSPCKAKQGFTFLRFVRELKACGYAVEHRELRACDYGVPTTRKRLFLVARCDGLPIVWPAPTHGAGRKPYLTAASIIDWSLPCRSIFGRKKPLAEATLRRIGRGVGKYVIDAAEPFIVTIDHQGSGTAPVYSAGSPVTSITSKARHAVVVPTLIQTGYGERPGQAPRVPGLDKPLGTAVGGGVKHAVVAAFLAKHYGGHEGSGSDLRRPIDTVTAKDHHSLVYAFLLKYYGTDQDPQLGEPLHTVTTKDRFALVTVKGEQYAIVDIGMRMLTPRELARAQGFPDSYKLELIIGGKPLSKEAQVRMIGNSVCPPLACALVKANLGQARRQALRRAA